jgi:hypothetical protein
MTKEDKIWFCKLAFWICNTIVYAIGDGLEVRNWRSGAKEKEKEFMELAEQ